MKSLRRWQQQLTTMTQVDNGQIAINIKAVKLQACMVFHYRMTFWNERKPEQDHITHTLT